MITVVNAGGNVLAVDAINKPVLDMLRGGVYTFSQSDASNIGHQLAFKDGTGATYSTGVATTGTLGTSGAQTVITVLIKRVFITNVKGTFLGMSESEEASKRR